MHPVDDYVLCAVHYLSHFHAVVMGAGKRKPIDDRLSDQALVKVRWYGMKPIT